MRPALDAAAFAEFQAFDVPDVRPVGPPPPTPLVLLGTAVVVVVFRRVVVVRGIVEVVVVGLMVVGAGGKAGAIEVVVVVETISATSSVRVDCELSSPTKANDVTAAKIPNL